jgi:hypothetical protein
LESGVGTVIIKINEKQVERLLNNYIYYDKMSTKINKYFLVGF